MRFAAPSYFYLLVLVPACAVFLVWAWRARKDALKKFAEAALAAKLCGEVSIPRRKLKEWLTAAAVLLFVVALARPQYGFEWEEINRRGVDIMIAMDVSKSMLAEDSKPNRLTFATRKIEDMLKIFKGDRVGLIAFAGKAFLLTPLTLDYGAIRAFTAMLEPKLTTANGTALSEAVELAVRALSEVNPRSKAMIILTDGEDLTGNVDAAAKIAKDAGLQVYAIGFGSTEGAPIPVEGGGFMKDDQGNMVLSKMNESTLGKLASETGGLSLRAVAGDEDIDTIYKAITGTLEEKAFKGGRKQLFHDRFQWVLFFLLAVLLVEPMIRDQRAKRRWSFRKFRFIPFSIALILLPSIVFAWNATGKVREGEKLYEEQKYAEALGKFLEAQVELPNDQRLKHNIADTYYKLGKFDDAEKIFSSIDPKQAHTFIEKNTYNRGNALYKGNHLDDAVKAYDEALKLNPSDEDARYNLEFVKKEIERRKQQEQQDKDKKGQDQKDQGQQNQDQQNQDQKQSQDQKQNEGQQQKQDQKQSEGQKQTGEQNKNEGQDQSQDTASEHQQDDPQQQDAQNADQTSMSKDEAKRWLSTVKEGQRKFFPQADVSDGKSKSKGGW